jgi:hypothetical protein
MPVRPKRSARTRTPDEKLVIGWAEWVSLPDLGVGRIKAKVDTGARTSALHVVGARKVGTEAPAVFGGPPRPVLEFRIPAGSQPVTARAVVSEFVTIKDSGGHPEKRPVIETTIVLGALSAKVRVSLTDRGDMMYPMLLGRTALGTHVHIDPGQRYRLTSRKRRPK